MIARQHYCHLFGFRVIKVGDAGIVVTPVCLDCGRRRRTVAKKAA